MLYLLPATISCTSGRCTDHLIWISLGGSGDIQRREAAVNEQVRRTHESAGAVTSTASLQRRPAPAGHFLNGCC